MQKQFFASLAWALAFESEAIPSLKFNKVASTFVVSRVFLQRSQIHLVIR